MKIVILGSGGYRATPQPLCKCSLCNQARKNHRAVRTGPSFFLPELDLLIDTPLEAKQHLQKIGSFPKKIFYSHWHPDHTEGYRVLESFVRPPTVYIPDGSSLQKKVPGITYLAKIGMVRLNQIIPGKNYSFPKGYTVRCIKLTQSIPAYAYLFCKKNLRVLICPDHARYLKDVATTNLRDLDLLIMNLGVPHTSRDKTSIYDNALLIKQFTPRRTILTHIEEHFFARTVHRARIQKLCKHIGVSLAHDFQIINIPSMVHERG